MYLQCVFRIIRYFHTDSSDSIRKMKGTNIMNITFTALSTERQSAVMEIINYYVQSGTAAFPAHALPEPFFAMLLKKAEGGYPACAVLDGDRVIGFCQFSAHSPFSTFSKTADCTYFL